MPRNLFNLESKNEERHSDKLEQSRVSPLPIYIRSENAFVNTAMEIPQFPYIIKGRRKY